MKITYNGSDLILAPIAGFSDAGMRSLSYKYGAGLCYTEMVSAKGLYYKNENTEDLLHTTEWDKYSGVQIFGSDAEIMGEVVKYDCIKKFPIIDINMGCPVPKVVRNGDGSALLKDPDKIYKIVKAVADNSDGRPVTVKIRTGIGGINCAKECALAIQEGGASMVPSTVERENKCIPARPITTRLAKLRKLSKYRFVVMAMWLIERAI